MRLGNTRNAETCTWRNFGVENSFSVLVFRILENLTTCGDIIFHTFRQKRAKTSYSFMKCCWRTLERWKLVSGLIFWCRINLRSYFLAYLKIWPPAVTSSSKFRQKGKNTCFFIKCCWRTPEKRNLVPRLIFWWRSYFWS